MTHAGEGSLVGNEKFTAPDMPVRSVTRPVHGQADDIPGKAVFRHAAHDMGMMVLNVKNGRGLPDAPAICRATRVA